MFRRSPEAEAGHGQGMKHTHILGTKKGIDQNRVDSDPGTAENIHGEGQRPHCSDSMAEDTCKSDASSAESYEHEKPVAEKRPGLQREEEKGWRSWCFCFWRATEDGYTAASSCHLISFLSETCVETKRPKVKKQNRSLTIRS